MKKKILFLLPRRLCQSPQPYVFIGTLSQTLTLRAAFTSSTYLREQIPGPACLNPPNPLFKGAHQASVRTRAQGHRFAVLRPASEDALFNPPIPLFKGRSGPAGFPSPRCLPCPPASARHLKMPANPSDVRAKELRGFLLPYTPGVQRHKERDL